LNPFLFWVVSGNILYAFVTDFLRKIPWKIREIPSNKDINKTVYKQTSVLYVNLVPEVINI